MDYNQFRIQYFIPSKLQLFIVLLFSFLFFGCTHKHSLQKNENLESVKPQETQILVFENGIFNSVSTDTKPEPTKGKNQFYRDMYLDLRYPADARERGIQGTVLFEVEISKEGDVLQIKKTQSLSPECDKEAEKAIRRGCKYGFKPYEFEGNIVRVKYLIPVNFKLE